MFAQCTESVNVGGHNAFGFSHFLSVVEVLLYYVTIILNAYILRKMKADYKKLYKLKTEYYKGELDVTELAQFGWEPQPLKILKQDIPSYLEADDDIIESSLKIGAQEQKVGYLESILKMIGNRGFQIKSIIDWERFRTGA